MQKQKACSLTQPSLAVLCSGSVLHGHRLVLGLLVKRSSRSVPVADAGFKTCWHDVEVAVHDESSAHGLDGILLRERQNQVYACILIMQVLRDTH